ncbi:MAG TPA: hypothetical protein VEN82_00450 [Actinomycetota bacterium]|nr:hypothetical protein [Actinomycetota bacterium]
MGSRSSARKRFKGAAVAALLALTACGGGTSTFNAHGVSFDYPGGWKALSALTVPATQSGSSRDAVGIDPSDSVVLVISQVKVPVTPANISAVQQTIAQALSQGASRTGGIVSEQPSALTVDGLPGFQMRIRGVRLAGVQVDSRFVVAFKGSTEYLFNCESTPSHTDEVEKGCQQVIDSFKVA